MKMSVEHWWYATDKMKSQYLSQCHFFHHKFVWIGLYLLSEKPTTNCQSHDTAIFEGWL